MTLEIVCFKWKPRHQYRSSFDARAVNTLRNMVQRNLKIPHRFSCITDDPKGLDPDIRVIPMWDEHASIPNPSIPHGPWCYPRLRLYSDEMRQVIGEKFVCLDLDIVITGDITPLFPAGQDFMICDGRSLERDAQRHTYCRYNGSMVMMRAGCRKHVYETFDPVRSPRLAHAGGHRGSDQGWVSYCLGEEATWTREHGVYSYKNHVRGQKQLPKDARIVIFTGKQKPWDSATVRESPWIKGHYY